MAIEFRTLRINFDPTKGRIQREEATAVFRANVEQAQAAMKGFQIGYTDGDHHIFREQINLEIVRRTGNAVTVAANFLLRDSSGNIDDRFDGWVDVVVIADTVAYPPT